ncbi:MAG: hypothetical protein GTO55_04195 [Armatimonadetes bacterium]|nr:hypothetical protein [Armatimonadota bacterium]NIM23472.1 hypothetical protein [Armatimonadota bacterium]NIM67338.1 hypothetical protein [Armatimonadota bacterium]NIM75839.1 hypothetical protein [Armatimonadota bacterium]NIN05524.1 hypothetical protein [Armatimonadota bacterium]
MEKHRVILDTDIGDDVDDAYALALLLCSPEIELEAVTVNIGKVTAKASIARRMLDIAGMQRIPVYVGLAGADPYKQGNQAAWAQNYQSDAVIGDDGVGELVRRVTASPSEITLIAIGPLTNLGAALEEDPDFGRKLKELIIMGGSIVHGYEYGERSAEYNIAHDTPASKEVFACGANLTVAPLDATNRQQVTARRMAQLAAAHNPICDALIELSALYERDFPTLHDPRACTVLLHEELATGPDMRLEVSDEGFTDLVPGVPNCKVIVEPKIDLFFQLLWERYLSFSNNKPAASKP